MSEAARIAELEKALAEAQQAIGEAQLNQRLISADREHVRAQLREAQQALERAETMVYRLQNAIAERGTRRICWPARDTGGTMGQNAEMGERRAEGGPMNNYDLIGGTIRESSSLQFVAHQVYEHTDAETLFAGVLWMRIHGSSVGMDWGEDNNCWEVSWITSGERFTGISSDLRVAVASSLALAFKSAALKEVDG